ncbi:MAG: hypothetical protein IK113_08780 [Bacteroidales bacterium]|nr:hypothetical protein [Bacteroidales bacterium]
MKKTIITICLALLGGALAFGQEYSNDVAVSNVEFVLDGTDLLGQMDLDFSYIDPSATEQRNYTLVLYAGDNYINFPIATLLGRRWFYHYARERRTSEPFSAEEHTWYWKDAPKPYHFVVYTPYQEWMELAKIRIDAEVGGCCGKEGETVKGVPVNSVTMPYIEPEPVKPVYRPQFIYVLPPAETTVKQRDISGEAYVVFASGKTAVDPAYKDNALELEKIRATIDSVRADVDVTITDVILKGYSSPDGKLATNEKLSKARTQAIKDYVSKLDTLLDDKVFKAESVAENWDGLRAAVEASELSAKDKLLEIIDSDIALDKKEAKIKASYPKQWAAMVKDIFPLLRRTDYRVSYTVKSYTTADDARRILHTAPANLSITEFFLAAQGYEMGTYEFDEVFKIAARIYPYDPVVNINAANAAMSLGNLTAAEAYLKRAGDSPVALYTKGVLCALQEDWEGAVMFFTSAKASGVPEATAACEIAKELLEFGK